MLAQASWRRFDLNSLLPRILENWTDRQPIRRLGTSLLTLLAMIGVGNNKR
jgi:hypothetical protein